MEKGSNSSSDFTRENLGFKPHHKKSGQVTKSPQPSISSISNEAIINAQRDKIIIEQNRLDKQEVEYQQKLAEVNAQAERNEAEKLRIANAQLEPNPHGLMSPLDKSNSSSTINNGQIIIPGTDPLLPTNLHRQLHSSESDRHVRFGGVASVDSVSTREPLVNLYTPSKYVLTQEELDELILDSNRRNQLIIDEHQSSMESTIRNQMSARKHKPLRLRELPIQSPCVNPTSQIGRIRPTVGV